MKLNFIRPFVTIWNQRKIVLACERGGPGSIPMPVRVGYFCVQPRRRFFSSPELPLSRVSITLPVCYV